MNTLTKDELIDLLTSVENGELFMDFRTRLGFSGELTPGELDDHVVRHWFNDRDEGWWPEFPTEEIRTATMYLVAKRLLPDRNENRLTKPVTNLWLCPSAEFFATAVIETSAAITVLHMTPPEGAWKKEPDESPNRPEWRRKVGEFFTNTNTQNQKRRATRTGPNTYRLEAPEVASPTDSGTFWTGRRIAIASGDAGRYNFRTVTNYDSNTQTLTVRHLRKKTNAPDPDPMNRGPEARPENSNGIDIFPMSDIRANEAPQIAHNWATKKNQSGENVGIEQTLWTITGRDMGTSTNNVRQLSDVEAAVVGVDVRVNVEGPMTATVGRTLTAPAT